MDWDWDIYTFAICFYYFKVTIRYIMFTLTYCDVVLIFLGTIFTRFSLGKYFPNSLFVAFIFLHYEKAAEVKVPSHYLLKIQIWHVLVVLFTIWFNFLR